MGITRHITPKDMRLFLVISSCLALSLSIPQGYGGGGGGSPARAPQQSQSSVQCRTEYVEIWDTQYIETETQKCEEKYQKQCYPVVKKSCQTLYRPKCVTKQRTEYYTETECGSQVKEDCEYHWEGTGSSKRWVPDPKTCRNNAYDSCQDVHKQTQVPYEDCNEKEPNEDCKDVTEQECRNEPYQDCKAVHKKVPNRVSKRVSKKTCDTGNGGFNQGSDFNQGGGFNQGSGFNQGGGLNQGGYGSNEVGNPLRSGKPEKQVETKSSKINFG